MNGGSANGAFLAEVRASLGKRRRALRRQLRGLRIDRITERSEAGDREKLEIDCLIATRLTVRLFVWEDRWVWLDARRASKTDGWLWAYMQEGRLFGDDPGRRLVEALEASVAATFEMTTDDVARFEEIWTPILARGPR